MELGKRLSKKTDATTTFFYFREFLPSRLPRASFSFRVSPPASLLPFFPERYATTVIGLQRYRGAVYSRVTSRAFPKRRLPVKKRFAKYLPRLKSRRLLALITARSRDGDGYAASGGMGILDGLAGDQDPFHWWHAGEAPGNLPELLDETDTDAPLGFAPPPGCGASSFPSRQITRPPPGRETRFSLDDQELSCIARSLLLDDLVDTPFTVDPGGLPGHPRDRRDDDRRKLRRRNFSSGHDESSLPFSSSGNAQKLLLETAQTQRDSFQTLFDFETEDSQDGLFAEMAVAKERDVSLCLDTFRHGKRGPGASRSEASPATDARFAEKRAKTKTLVAKPQKSQTKSTVATPSPISNKPVAFPLTPPPGRSSRFRGVTKHRWTGRYEAHLWDSSFERVAKKTAETELVEKGTAMGVSRIRRRAV